MNDRKYSCQNCYGKMKWADEDKRNVLICTRCGLIVDISKLNAKYRKFFECLHRYDYNHPYWNHVCCKCGFNEHKYAGLSWFYHDDDPADPENDPE